MNQAYSVDTLRQLAVGDDFYREMLADFNRAGGCLTRSQVEALRERDVAPAQRALPLPSSSSKLEAAIAHARSKGVEQPIIRVAGFNFMPADPKRARPENRDAIFVTTKEQNGTYLGKVITGTFSPSYNCTGDQLAGVIYAMQDPLTAAVSYGRATGRCSICDRTLSNTKSVELGIGPICKAKFGW